MSRKTEGICAEVGDPWKSEREVECMYVYLYVKEMLYLRTRKKKRINQELQGIAASAYVPCARTCSPRKERAGVDRQFSWLPANFKRTEGRVWKKNAVFLSLSLPLSLSLVHASSPCDTRTWIYTHLYIDFLYFTGTVFLPLGFSETMRTTESLHCPREEYKNISFWKCVRETE